MMSPSTSINCKLRDMPSLLNGRYLLQAVLINAEFMTQSMQASQCLGTNTSQVKIWNCVKLRSGTLLILCKVIDSACSVNRYSRHM